MKRFCLSRQTVAGSMVLFSISTLGMSVYTRLLTSSRSEAYPSSLLPATTRLLYQLPMLARPGARSPSTKHSLSGCSRIQDPGNDWTWHWAVKSQHPAGEEREAQG